MGKREKKTVMKRERTRGEMAKAERRVGEAVADGEGGQLGAEAEKGALREREKEEGEG